jgi:hypothetical protein
MRQNDGNQENGQMVIQEKLLELYLEITDDGVEVSVEMSCKDPNSANR